MIFKVSGGVNKGFGGREPSLYLYQQLVLSLATHRPNAILVDLRDLICYSDIALKKIFEVFSQIQFFKTDEILHCYILSKKNIDSLAYLLSFNSQNPRTPFFYDFKEGHN